jgi:hypothetical protein
VAIAAMSLAVAVVLGLLNRAIAKRALQLAARQEARPASLDLHMNESVAWRRSMGERLVGFHVLVMDRPSSLVSAKLHVTYGVDGVMTTVKVPHASSGLGDAVPAEVGPIGLPARLDANDALSGWTPVPP